MRDIVGGGRKVSYLCLQMLDEYQGSYLKQIHSYGRQNTLYTRQFATYYYRLRKVRLACLNVMTPPKTVFVELSLPDATKTKPDINTFRLSTNRAFSIHYIFNEAMAATAGVDNACEKTDDSILSYGLLTFIMTK